MKYIASLLLTLFVLGSVPFMGGESLSVSGQVVTKTKTTTRNVSHKTKVTSKKVGRKTWRGTKHVAHKTRVKSQPVRKKTWRTGRKVVSRTKKIFS